MKWKMIARFLALLVVLSAASSAYAECFVSAGDNLGKPRTDIEEGRSDTLTAPLVSWNELRGNSCATTVYESNASVCAAPTYAPTACVSSPCAPSACEPTPTGTPAKPAPSPTAQPTPEKEDENGTEGHYTPGSLSSQERYLVEAINEERVANGLSALPVDLRASSLAREKSRDMVQNNYFAHESPTYGHAADMLDDANYEYTSVGENIARSGSVEKAHAALMSSDGHRRNILGSQWKRVAVGVVNDKNGYPYVTEWFIR